MRISGYIFHFRSVKNNIWVEIGTNNKGDF